MLAKRGPGSKDIGEWLPRGQKAAQKVCVLLIASANAAAAAAAAMKRNMRAMHACGSFSFPSFATSFRSPLYPGFSSSSPAHHFRVASGTLYR